MARVCAAAIEMRQVFTKKAIVYSIVEKCYDIFRSKYLGSPETLDTNQKRHVQEVILGKRAFISIPSQDLEEVAYLMRNFFELVLYRVNLIRASPVDNAMAANMTLFASDLESYYSVYQEDPRMEAPADLGLSLRPIAEEFVRQLVNDF